MDGVRAYWNGNKLISRHGKEIPCPNWFIEGFPSDIRLDGELWLGRERYEDLMVALKNDEEVWKSSRYIIFDVPSSKQPYEDRMNELRKIKLVSHMEIIPNQQCKGNDGIYDALTAITEKAGEGLMAIEPQSLYSLGERTNRLLKVKKQDDSEVRILEILPTGLYCLQ